ncbi:hypothetical protein JAAARDRAFT_34018 [Jaapia argillacea MUCL 33604]|uniref:Uncharacterized protein n=1 Tax=Jaapia argillacea MUCL 33604 TaxID=933084 RepID=A0A067PZH4_9AGAM|nr:hypothetical protein JAAARDRAFT_34018 [Jaapia argillacea MUCL 33604]
MPVKGVVINSGKPKAKPLDVQRPERQHEVLQSFFQPLLPRAQFPRAQLPRVAVANTEPAPSAKRLDNKSQHEILQKFFESLLAERERGSAVSPSDSKEEGTSSAPDNQGLRDAVPVPEAQGEEGKVVDERTASESEPSTVPFEQKDDQPTVGQDKQSPGSENHLAVESPEDSKTEPEMSKEQDSS